MHRSKLGLFDYLIGGEQQIAWYSEAKRFCGSQIDHELKFGWLLNGQIPWLFTA